MSSMFDDLEDQDNNDLQSSDAVSEQSGSESAKQQEPAVEKSIEQSAELTADQQTIDESNDEQVLEEQALDETLDEQQIEDSSGEQDEALTDTEEGSTSEDPEAYLEQVHEYDLRSQAEHEELDEFALLEDTEGELVEDEEEMLTVTEPYGGFEPNRLKSILEGCIFASTKPINIAGMQSVFEIHERPSRKEIKLLMTELEVSYQDKGVRLVETANGYRFQTATDDAPWVSKLFEDAPKKYSRAMLETLALIAYRQPITRGEIEDVRGVAVSSYIIKTMIERQWIRVVGQRDVPGRPSMFATTKTFLDYFGLASLDQLPSLSEIKDLEDLMPELKLDDQDAGAVSPDREAGFSELVDTLRNDTGKDDEDSYLDNELAKDLMGLDEVNDSIEASFAAAREKAQLEKEAEERAALGLDDPEDESVDDSIDRESGQSDQPNQDLQPDISSLASNQASGQALDFATLEDHFDAQTEEESEVELDIAQPTGSGFDADSLFASLSDEPSTTKSVQQNQTPEPTRQLDVNNEESAPVLTTEEEQMRFIQEKLAQQAALLAGIDDDKEE